MKKRITALILIFALAFNAIGFSAFGAAEKTASDELKGIDYIAVRLSKFSHEDRANIETILIPLLITDTGLDTLVRTVSEYTPESEALMHQLLGKLLVRVDKDEITEAISYLYMIDEKVREEYIGGYYQRKEAELSVKAEKAMDTLMSAVFLKYPELEQVFAEDNITAGVIARTLKMFSEVNGGVEIFRENKYGELEVNFINEDLKAKIDLCLKDGKTGFSDTEELLDSLCAAVNAYGKDNIKNIITVGDEVNLIRKNALTASGGKVEYVNAETNEAGDGIVVNGDGFEAGTLFAVRFEYDRNGILKDPDGEVVRLSVYDGGVWYALLEKAGVYTVEESAENYFDDVDGWGKSFINMLYERKIISGRTENLFCPDDNITREEFVKLIVELFDLKGDYGSFFTDVAKDAWYYEYVSAAKYFGIVDGYEDGSFGAGKNITRQDMCKILYSVVQMMDVNLEGSGVTTSFADKNQIADYAYPSVMALKKADIVSGDEKGRFNPQNNATRQEAAKLIYKILECYVKY